MLREPSNVITQLQKENADLRSENAELRRRLSHRVVTKQSGGIDPNKLVSEWNVQDFILYFKDKFADYASKEYRFSRRAYVAVLAQIGQFLKRERMSNEQFKELIDFHFNNTFGPRLDPSIPFICSAAGMNAYHAKMAAMSRGGEFVGRRYSQRPRQEFDAAHHPVNMGDVREVDAALKRLEIRRKVVRRS